MKTSLVHVKAWFWTAGFLLVKDLVICYTVSLISRVVYKPLPLKESRLHRQDNKLHSVKSTTVWLLWKSCIVNLPYATFHWNADHNKTNIKEQKSSMLALTGITWSCKWFSSPDVMQTWLNVLNVRLFVAEAIHNVSRLVLGLIFN